MELTYTWALTSLSKANAGDLSDVIIQTRWTCTGTDENGNTGVFNGATPFKADDVNPDTFVTYEELTEATVLDWIKSVVVGDYKDHIDQQIAKQIAAKTNPAEEVTDGNFPWSPPAE